MRVSSDCDCVYRRELAAIGKLTISGRADKTPNCDVFRSYPFIKLMCDATHTHRLS